MIKLLIAAAVGAALTFGAVHQGIVSGPAKAFSYTKFATSADQLGCKAIATAMLIEDPGLGPDGQRLGNVRVVAERGTDTVSLKIDSAARQLKIATGAGVSIGRTEADVMTIVRDDANTLVAVQITDTAGDVFVLRLDRNSGNAVWGKVGNFMLSGLVGWSHYLECR